MVSTAAEIFSSEMETPLIIGPSAIEWIPVPPNKVASSPHLPCNESIDGYVVLENSMNMVKLMVMWDQTSLR